MRRGMYPDDKFELNCTRGETDPIERVPRKRRLNVIILVAAIVVDILEEKGQQLTYGVRAK